VLDCSDDDDNACCTLLRCAALTGQLVNSKDCTANTSSRAAHQAASRSTLREPGPVRSVEHTPSCTCWAQQLDLGAAHTRAAPATVALLTSGMPNLSSSPTAAVTMAHKKGTRQPQTNSAAAGGHGPGTHKCVSARKRQRGCADTCRHMPAV
jgi:hypothetical protein